MQGRITILPFGLFLALAGCGGIPIHPSSTGSALSTPSDLVTFGLWPHVSGRVGAYYAHGTAEILNMSSAGLSLVLGAGDPTPSQEITMQTAGVSQIDPYPVNLITNACSGYFSGSTASCQISDATSRSILTQLEIHLAIHKSDGNVVAYYFLDDYPGGDISVLLQKMHTLLVVSNGDPNSSFPRPAICAFGGLILPTGDTDTTTLADSFRRVVANFSPGYCDMVALYPYAMNGTNKPNDPSQYDWSMSYVLPMMFKCLQDRGWDISKQPLIGIPQAFGYKYWVAPTAAELTVQMLAFCKAGAVALIAYAWNDGWPSAHPDSPATEAYNSSEIRSGLTQGTAACRAYWPKGFNSH